MKGRSVSMEVKRDLRNTVIVPTLTYASETWAWNECQRSRVQAVEMSYLRSACGVSRMDGVSNECVYERFGMSHVGVGKKCGVVEEVKRQTLKWFLRLLQKDMIAFGRVAPVFDCYASRFSWLRNRSIE